MTELYLIRHGQTTGNVMGINQGTTNTAIAYLNDHGRQQIQQLQQHFDIRFADQLITSPLVRTQQTRRS
jgi:Fructose-2,6-bisphosphatase